MTEQPSAADSLAGTREDAVGRPVELTDPLRLPCGLVLPNRIAKAAMTECLADPRTNDANTRHEQLYRRWAAGGVGLMVTGNVMVDRRYLERTTNVVIDGRTDRAALERWAQAAQSTGVPTLVQVNHPGRQCSVFVSRSPVAPSRVKVRFSARSRRRARCPMTRSMRWSPGTRRSPGRWWPRGSPGCRSTPRTGTWPASSCPRGRTCAPTAGAGRWRTGPGSCSRRYAARGPRSDRGRWWR